MNKYNREIKSVKIDIYDILRAYGITDPALAHGLKKLLCAGQRGHKTVIQDLKEGIDSCSMYLDYIKNNATIKDETTIEQVAEQVNKKISKPGCMTDVTTDSMSMLNKLHSFIIGLISNV